MDFKENIRSLVGIGQLEKAINEFRGAAKDNDLRNSLLNLLGRLNRVNNRERDGLGTTQSIDTERNKIQVALLQYLDKFEVPANVESSTEQFTNKNIPGTMDHFEGGGATPVDIAQKPKVFISYRHKNLDEAKEVKAFLEKNDIEVLIDFEQLGSDRSIDDFIIDMIKKSDATLSIVSTASLSSPWVAQESDLTLQAEKFKDDTKFFTCSLDGGFFEADFTNERIKEGIKEIKKLEGEKEERIELLGEMANTRDLDSKIKRYKAYLGSLPDIIDRLNNFLTVDISGDKFESGLTHVINSIKKITS